MSWFSTFMRDPGDVASRPTTRPATPVGVDSGAEFFRADLFFLPPGLCDGEPRRGLEPGGAGLPEFVLWHPPPTGACEPLVVSRVRRTFFMITAGRRTVKR